MNFKKYISPFLLAGLCVIVFPGYAADPHWTYDEQTVWGALENTDNTATVPALYPFAECGLGQKQSPIEIATLAANAAPNNNIAPAYLTIPLSITNNGHTIKVNMPAVNQNAFFIGQEKYELLQLHFHAPSEHTINGKTFPLEMHFVHATPSGKLAVLGVLMKAGTRANPEFQKILDNAPVVPGTTKTPVNTTIDLRAFLPISKKFYTYSGSLTTPPCIEGVNWYVLRWAIEVSNTQITQFKTLYSGNARAVQDLNNRIIETLPSIAP